MKVDNASVEDGSAPRANLRTRALIFAVVCAVCIAGGAGYAVHSARHAQTSAATIASTPIVRLEVASTAPGATTMPAPSQAATRSAPLEGSPTAERTQTASHRANTKRAQDATVAKVEHTLTDADASPQISDDASSTSSAAARPYMLYRSTALGETYGRVGVKYLDGADDSRYVSPLVCDRVHFAAGNGLCLEAKRGVFTTFTAHIFDRDFRIRHSVPLTGVPSRARLSPDGTRAAFTVFVSGHSYAGADFSTRTSIVDAADGKVLVEDLEDFVVLKNAMPFKAQDFNFWGVTFTRDNNRFYATLGTGGEFYLIEGNVAARTARVVHVGVECPSLSPDNTRVAFKRRVASGDGVARFVWRLYVLDLASLRETALQGETRNVDDQVEWLDDEQILYALPDDVQHATAATNTWALPSDGTGEPHLLMSLAFSPAVVR